MQYWKSEPCGTHQVAEVCTVRVCLQTTEWQQRRALREVKQGKEGYEWPGTICSSSDVLCYISALSTQPRELCLFLEQWLHYMPVPFGSETFNGSLKADPSAELAFKPLEASAEMQLLLYCLSCLIWLSTGVFTLALSLLLSLNTCLYIPYKYM